MNRNISKFFIYHVFDQKCFPEIHKKWLEFERTQWLPKEKLYENQWHRLQKLLRHAYQNVPYYRKKFNEVGIQPQDIKSLEDVVNIPILRKSDLRENLHDLVVSNYQDRMIKNSTGGSTGEPTIFYQDNEFFNIQNAIGHRVDKWAGLEIGCPNIWIWGTSFNVSPIKKLRATITSYLTNTHFLSAFELNEPMLMRYIRKLKRLKPKVIIGYVSCLYVMAQFMIANKIEDICPYSVISSAEILHDYQREAIEKAFNCKVFNRYGSREVGCIAQECDRHSGLHINAEHVYLECIHNSKLITNQDLGALIVTSLSNFAMPFIRYEIGDLGVLSDEDCPCGRGLPLIKSVSGRIHNIIVCDNGNFIPGEFFSLILKDYKWIIGFQVIQSDKKNLEIKIQNNGEISKGDVRDFQQKIHDMVGDKINVTYDFVDKIDKTRSGKYRVTVSNVPISFT